MIENLQAFVWIVRHVQFVFFTTKDTKLTKLGEIYSETFVLFASPSKIAE
jgi:hypothetical protein